MTAAILAMRASLLVSFGLYRVPAVAGTVSELRTEFNDVHLFAVQHLRRPAKWLNSEHY
jgi:hypothetical protein